ncbi:MAG: hypothetical protein ACK4VI_02235 [Alphaproteobacteria bacterium]
MKHILKLLTLSFFLFCYSSHALAQCVAGAPCIHTEYEPPSSDNDDKRGEAESCDGDFMNQIYARAFLEAQRENIMNQTYIRKPDSTLQYTCIDRFVNHLARHAPPLFSETTRWQNAIVPLNIRFAAAGNPDRIPLRVFMGTGHIVPRLDDMLSHTITEYIDSNFDHNSLGGSGGTMTAMQDSVSPGDYACSTMTQVWQLAKCFNFPAASTLFMTFDELVSNDPRTLPEVCDNTVITSELIETARNPGPAFSAASFDVLDPLTDMIRPMDSGESCGSAIPTGLSFEAYDISITGPTDDLPSGVTMTTTPEQEFLCINPGCYYSASSGSCRRSP